MQPTSPPPARSIANPLAHRNGNARSGNDRVFAPELLTSCLADLRRQLDLRKSMP